MISYADRCTTLGGSYRCAWEEEKTRQEAGEAEKIVENEESPNPSEDLCSCCHLDVVCV